MKLDLNITNESDLRPKHWKRCIFSLPPKQVYGTETLEGMALCGLHEAGEGVLFARMQLLDR